MRNENLNINRRKSYPLGIRGISFVEVMFAMGISSIVMIGIMNSSRDMFANKKTSETQQSLSALMYDMNGLLNNGPICTAIFYGKHISSTNGTSLNLSSAISPGSTYGKLTITDVTLQNVSQLNGPYYMADVTVAGQKATSSYGATNFTQIAKVYYNIDGSNNIDQCLASPISPAYNCITLGGTWGGTSCDFCSYLGGVKSGDGSCQLAGTTPYVWDIGEWGNCLGTNVQFRNVQCLNARDSTIVNNSNCIDSQPPSSQACIIATPTYAWQFTAWGTCGGGVKSRTVNCINAGTLDIVANGNCTTAQPASSANCNDYQWQVAAWDPATYTHGHKSRTVQCYDTVNLVVVADDLCPAPKPIFTASCSGTEVCDDSGGQLDD